MKTFHRLPALPMLVFSLLVGITLSLAHAPYSYAEEENQTETPALTTEQTVATDDAADAAAIDEQAVVPAELSYAMEMAEVTPGEDYESDPWESFNEKMFWFNKEVLDRYLLKPAATAWDFVLPDGVQRSLHNAFDNLKVVPRVVNNALQLKFAGAAKEVARFAINSTVGFIGFFDVAKDGFGIEQSDEDLGQTLGVWGVGPGPYLVLPFLPPATVRDGIGFAIDGAMNPLYYFIPWYASIGANVTEIVNERSLNLDRFERVEESTIDLYSAVRNAYLQRRAAAIKQ